MRRSALLLLALLVGCGADAPTSPTEFSGAAGSAERFGVGPAPGGGFIPGGGGTASSGGLSSVFANAPLTGNGTSGSHLGLSLPGASCGTGQAVTALSSGGTGTCAGVGTVTSVVAGTGLSGGTITGAGTVAVNLTPTTCAAGAAETATASDGTSTCSTFIDTAGTSLSKSGHTLNVSMPGGTCAAGKMVTSVAADGTATCANVIPNDYSGTHLEFVDEYMFQNCGSTAANTGACGSIWSPVNSGTGTQVASTATTTRPGVVQFTTGSTAAGRSVLQSAVNIDFASASWTMEWTGGWETLSDGASPTDGYAAFIGFGDTNTSINISNGCGFLYDRTNAATGGANSGNANNLECECAAGGVRTFYLMNGAGNSDESFALGTVSVGALTLPSTNILDLKLVMTGTTRAEFFTCTTPGSCTKVCDINTHIPSGSSQLTGALQKLIKSVGTNARTMDVDRTRYAADLNAARSP